MSFQPTFHRRSLVRGIIVQNQMNLQIHRNFPINRLEELNPLLVPVTLRTVGKNFAFQIIQSGKQSRVPWR